MYSVYKLDIFRSSGSRKQYASLDINSMGVDIARGPITELDNKVSAIVSKTGVDLARGPITELDNKVSAIVSKAGVKK